MGAAGVFIKVEEEGPKKECGRGALPTSHEGVDGGRAGSQLGFPRERHGDSSPAQMRPRACLPTHSPTCGPQGAYCGETLGQVLQGEGAGCGEGG